jgi:L-aminopeptidase/D-esterase-like protein
MVANEELDPIFDATVSAVEEAIVNALVAAESMAGRDEHKVIAIPQDRLREVMKKYGRLGNDE